MGKFFGCVAHVKLANSGSRDGSNVVFLVYCNSDP
jgi:hypothetical protein